VYVGDGTHHAAGLPRADFRDEELRAVGKNQRHPVALPDAERGERGGKRVALAVKLGVGNLAPLKSSAGFEPLSRASEER